MWEDYSLEQTHEIAAKASLKSTKARTRNPTKQIEIMEVKEKLRLRLFRLKTLLGNYFTPLCVFGIYEKYG